jgi:sugar/nucleoside kinase (ribokinase family)
MKLLDVVVVGELNADLILTGLPGLPALGELKLARGMCLTLGSASAIFASNIARLGMKVGFVGKVGADEIGEFIVQRLQRERVDVSRIIHADGATTGICVSLSFPGEYAQASYPGVRETFTLADVDMDFVISARHLHLSSYYIQPGMIPGCPELFRKAKEEGLSTSLDPDTDPSGLWDESIYRVLEYVDVFLPNEVEALKISGQRDLGSALQELAKRVKTVAIKRGRDGAVLQNQQVRLSATGFPVDPVDTTGAGDSFNAGFLFQYLQGGSLETCLQWGNACGALSTRAMGGTTSFPTRDEVDRFLAENSSESCPATLGQLR